MTLKSWKPAAWKIGAWRLGAWEAKASDHVLTGDAYVESGEHEVDGVASIFAHAPSQYVGARPGGRHGVIPPTAFILAEYQRQEVERQLARLVTGDIAVEQDHAVEVLASGRVRSVRLVATASVESTEAVECEASGQFVDVELEMVALLLAA